MEGIFVHSSDPASPPLRLSGSKRKAHRHPSESPEAPRRRAHRGSSRDSSIELVGMPSKARAQAGPSRAVNRVKKRDTTPESPDPLNCISPYKAAPFLKVHKRLGRDDGYESPDEIDALSDDRFSSPEATPTKAKPLATKDMNYAGPAPHVGRAKEAPSNIIAPKQHVNKTKPTVPPPGARIPRPKVKARPPPPSSTPTSPEPDKPKVRAGNSSKLLKRLSSMEIDTDATPRPRHAPTSGRLLSKKSLPSATQGLSDSDDLDALLETDREKQRRREAAERRARADEELAAKTAALNDLLMNGDVSVELPAAPAGSEFFDAFDIGRVQDERRMLERLHTLSEARDALSPVKPKIPEYDHPTNICEFCSHPLPLNPTPELLALRKRVDHTSHGWNRRVEYCAQHRAETSTIPHGIRAGYPTNIDFVALDERLENGFVASRLRRVIADPALSKFFRRAQREIDAMGMMKWKSLSHQAKDSVLNRATAGYYGDIGRAIMIRHFELLAQAGLFDLSSVTIEPLLAADFIVVVLVPEAAVLLIMQDKGWTGRPSGSAWDKARKEAMLVRDASAPYGHCRFKEESGKEIMARVEARVSEKKARLKSMADAAERDGVRLAKAARIEPWDDSDEEEVKEGTANGRKGRSSQVIIVSSDTDAREESDWGSSDWDSAIAAIPDYGVDTTPTKQRKHSKERESVPRMPRHCLTPMAVPRSHTGGEVSSPAPKPSQRKVERPSPKRKLIPSSLPPSQRSSSPASSAGGWDLTYTGEAKHTRWS